MTQHHREPTTVTTPPAASAVIGVARRDITPPIGIYARQWGAAEHDVTEGVHRPLSLTTMAILPHAGGQPLILVGGDWGWFRNAKFDLMERIVDPICQEVGTTVDRVVFNCSHTHAACSVMSRAADQPGGHLIAPYLDQIAWAAMNAAKEAMARAVPATLTWATGRCGLATYRDLPEPESSRRAVKQRLETWAKPQEHRFLTGYHPDVPADDTLLVGRVTRDSDDQVIGTTVNYACHPTTLAWDNRLASPDYVGAMREVVEQHTGGAPCMFLQGASGELAPAHQYVGDTAIADQHGRYLGYSAVAALTSMLAPRHGLSFDRVVESGAPLGVWLPRPFEPDATVAARMVEAPLPLKPDLPTFEEMEERMARATDRTMIERYRRARERVRDLSRDGVQKMPLWVWRIGRTLMVHQGNEAYSDFQIALREAFPDYAVVVTNVSNGGLGYLCPPDRHDLDVYQAWVTPFDRPALGVLIDEARRAAGELAGA